MDEEKLMNEAIRAREKSYSPYSEFAVGAALLCKDGRIYHGANIENASYSLCMCAERNAVYHALCDGRKKEDFIALAVVADTIRPVSPCGACRQVLSELLPEDAPIYLGNLDGDIEETTVEDLLPGAFTKDDL
ncbi:MAG: cytidine deaminase [Candidatus Enteromonas sp.]|nr:cytidine deaminase [Candidatus Enteromonas sp.]